MFAASWLQLPPGCLPSCVATQLAYASVSPAKAFVYASSLIISALSSEPITETTVNCPLF